MIKGFRSEIGLMQTIIADNGKWYADVAKALSADCRAVRPYHSWERGLTGYTSGPGKVWFPKLTDSGPWIRRERDVLNNHPRRVLDNQMPSEAFREVLAAFWSNMGLFPGTAPRKGRGPEWRKLPCGASKTPTTADSGLEGHPPALGYAPGSSIGCGSQYRSRTLDQAGEN